MTNARLLTNTFAKPYMSINREERNLTALLYGALLVNDNMSKMLNLVGYDLPVEPEQTVAYYEYAFLRDLWNRGELDNAGKRDLITQLLATKDVQALAGVSTGEWNEHFGCGGKTLSKKSVQSPGSWALTRYNKNIPDNDEFLQTTRFKWCWNTKPDLVVHTTLDHALVIEAKLESGEGRYPGTTADRDVFAQRGLPPVGQFELQQHMVNVLLGIETRHLFIIKTKAATSSTQMTITWHEIFDALNLDGLPPFVKTWVAQYSPM